MNELRLHTIDLPNFVNQIHRQTIGFNRVFDELTRSFATSKSAGNYPPHNVIELDETHYVIEVAVAGFRENEIDIELNANLLTVKGERAKDENSPEVKYHHRGISARNFTQTFTLAENVEVRGATVQNGILSIALELVIPEENLPKKIAIAYKK